MGDDDKIANPKNRAPTGTLPYRGALATRRRASASSPASIGFYGQQLQIREKILKFKGNFKAAAITALGLLLLATVAGVAISALTTVRDATEDTPAEFVGMSAEVAVGPVTAVVSVAPHQSHRS